MLHFKHVPFINFTLIWEQKSQINFMAGSTTFRPGRLWGRPGPEGRPHNVLEKKGGPFMY
jgi:hypothetical protein